MLLLALSLLTPAHADCMAGSLSVWPPANAAIPAGGQVVLHAYGSERPRLGALHRGDVVLVQGDRQIPLTPVGGHHGSFMDDQALFVPAEPPGPGSWALHVEGAPLTQWTRAAGQHTVAWTFERTEPATPHWTASPEVVDRSREHFGCGPGVDVAVLVPTEGATWIETTLSPVGRDDAVTARVPIEAGRISIGHGMCSGLFELEQGTVYEATLVAIGPDGQRVHAENGPLRFEAP